MPHLAITNVDSHCVHHISYDIRGPDTAEHKILFIMGLLTDGQAWDFQCGYFSKHSSSNYQCVSFDNRGVGLSECPLERITTHKLAEDALALCNHLQWNEYHIVGISMGGMIALELSLLAPERCVSLSLMCTHAGGITSLPVLPEAGLTTLKCFLSNSTESRIHHAMSLLYGKRTMNDPQKYKLLFEHHKRRLSTRKPPKFFGAIGQLLAVATHYISYPQLHQLKQCKFPKLIMSGTEDKLVREINSYLLHKAIGGDFVVLDGAGHGFLVEYPDEVNMQLEQLFTRATRQRKHEHAAGKHDIDIDNSTALIPYQSQQQSLIELMKISVRMAADVHMKCMGDVMAHVWEGLTARFPLP